MLKIILIAEMVATVENGWICNVVLLSYVIFPALCNNGAIVLPCEYLLGLHHCSRVLFLRGSALIGSVWFVCALYGVMLAVLLCSLYFGVCIVLTVICNIRTVWPSLPRCEQAG